MRSWDEIAELETRWPVRLVAVPLAVTAVVALGGRGGQAGSRDACLTATGNGGGNRCAEIISHPSWFYVPAVLALVLMLGWGATRRHDGVLIAVAVTVFLAFLGLFGLQMWALSGQAGGP